MIVTLKPINIGALADWDTGNVTDMSSMFDGCSSLTDLNALINGDTSAVNNMKAMFNGISQLTDTSALNDWDMHIPQELRIRSRGTERHSASN